MKPTDFSKYLTDFLSIYLPGERGFSTNTIRSYKDTFVLLLRFMHENKGININTLKLSHMNQEIILEFLNWLEVTRKCSITTRNARLAAIHSFFHYVQYSNPILLHEWQRILAIPFKKANKSTRSYLSTDEIKILLSQPDQSTEKGKRDLAMMSLMYDSGARVQEIIDITPAAINFNKPYTLKIKGKGNKKRIIPLMEAQVKILRIYMDTQHLLDSKYSATPLFCNSRLEKFTRMGLNNILQKYVEQARANQGCDFSNKVTPHTLRHSKAMHLLQAGVNIIYIRDFLGHSSITTTEIYAKADTKMKREAIEKAYPNSVDVKTEESIWINNAGIMDWLKKLK